MAGYVLYHSTKSKHPLSVIIWTQIKGLALLDSNEGRSERKMKPHRMWNPDMETQWTQKKSKLSPLLSSINSLGFTFVCSEHCKSVPPFTTLDPKGQVQEPWISHSVWIKTHTPTSAAKDPDNSYHMRTNMKPDKPAHTHTVTKLLVINQLYNRIPPNSEEEEAEGEEGVVHMCDALAVIRVTPFSFRDLESRTNGAAVC